MVVCYSCRHCGKDMGILKGTDMKVSSLFNDFLKGQGLTEKLLPEKNGSFRLEIICEYCQQALDAYPDYHELDYFLH